MTRRRGIPGRLLWYPRQNAMYSLMAQTPWGGQTIRVNKTRLLSTGMVGLGVETRGLLCICSTTARRTVADE